jgi:hypothetical protein
MLNNNEATLAEKKFPFESPKMVSHQWSFEMFRLILTIFELFADNRFDSYRDAH